jgi:hypothetical protein
MSFVQELEAPGFIKQLYKKREPEAKFRMSFSFRISKILDGRQVKRQ